MSPPTARLEVVAGNASGMSILVDGELLIGRHAQGAGRLAEDAEISRSHARVTVEESGFCAIEDLGSTNGTFVNGLRLSGPQTLSEGDTIELGATTLVVRDLPTVAADETRAASSPQPTVVPGVTPEPAAPEDEKPAEPDPETLVGAPTPDEQGAPPEAGAFIGLAPALEGLAPALEGLAPALEGLKPALESLSADTPDAQSPDQPPPDQPAPGEQPAGAQAPAPSAGQLRLQLEVDFEAREARIFLEGIAEPVRLGFESGAWQLTLPPSS